MSKALQEILTVAGVFLVCAVVFNLKPPAMNWQDFVLGTLAVTAVLHWFRDWPESTLADFTKERDNIDDKR